MGYQTNEVIYLKVVNLVVKWVKTNIRLLRLEQGLLGREGDRGLEDGGRV